MKNGLEEYGEMLIGGVVAVMILVLIFSAGLLSVVGKRAQLQKKDYSNYQDFQIFSKVCQRTAPKIFYNEQKQWYAGNIISIEEIFWGEDAEGEKLVVEVQEIVDKSGNNQMKMYQQDTQKVIFPEAGIYVFKLRVQDKEKRYAVEEIEIPVDKREKK